MKHNRKGQATPRVIWITRDRINVDVKNPLLKNPKVRTMMNLKPLVHPVSIGYPSLSLQCCFSTVSLCNQCFQRLSTMLVLQRSHLLCTYAMMMLLCTQGMPLSKFKKILGPGCLTPTFQKSIARGNKPDESLCFSIVGPDRAFDLECPDAETLHSLMAGLSRLGRPPC